MAERPESASETAPAEAMAPAEAALRPDVETNGDATVISRPAASDNGPSTDSAPTRIVGKPGNQEVPGGEILGERLGGYELSGTLGVGGMATVLRATDVSLDRPVALKVLPPEMARDPENVKRFHLEAKAAAKLDHENIARVFAYGTDRGLHFIAYEFVEGETLRARINRVGQVPIAEAVRVGVQIASGLAHATDRGVVHRDIKPSNILITPEGKAKLVDMGLARCQVLPADGGLTHSGVTLGTFDYISPEQALDPRQADCRSDLYSLGCTLYHALTGQSPVPQGTAMRKLQAHQQEAPLDPRLVNSAISDDLAAVLGRLLAKEPKDRFQHPRELEEALRKLEFTGPTPRAEPLSKGTALRHRLVAQAPLLLVGVLLLVATVAFNAWRYPAVLESSSPQEDLAQSRPAVASDAATGKELPRQDLVRKAATVEQLRHLLSERLPGTILLTGDRYDLGTGPALVADQPRLVIRAPVGARPRLRLNRSLAEVAPQGQAAVLIQRSGDLQLENLQFEIADTTGQPSGALTGVLVQGGHLVCEGCTFKQEADPLRFAATTPLKESTRNVLVAACLEAKADPEASMEFRQCLFAGGEVALALRGGLALLTDCVLGPYRLPVRMDGERGADGAAVRLELNQCTVLVHRAFALLDFPNDVRMRVDNSVIGPAEWEPRSTPEHAMLIFGQTDPARVELQGQGNYLCRLDPLAAVEVGSAMQPLARTLGELQALLGEANGSFGEIDDRLPWQRADALTRLPQLDPVAARQAVQLTTRLARLRGGPQSMKGVRRLLGEAVYTNLEPLPRPAPEATFGGVREATVDGVGRMPGTFATIEQALKSFGDNEEQRLLLKLNGPVPLITLLVENRRLFIRGAPGFSPELYLQNDAAEAPSGEAALFRLTHGSLTLEQLAVRVSALPRQGERTVAVAALAGSGRVRLTACQVTLAGDDDQVAALLMLSTPGSGSPMDMMSSPNSSGQPAMEVVDSLIRGRGDVLVASPYQPFALEARNTAMALQGTLVLLQGQRPVEMQLMPDAATVRLDQVSAFLQRGLLWYRASGSESNHPPVRVEALSRSVFLTGDGQALIRIEGARTEMEIKRRLLWKGRQNVYGGSALLNGQPADSTGLTQVYDPARWRELWGRDEEQPRFLRDLRLAGQPEQRATLENISPAALRPLTMDGTDLDLESCGANLSRIYSQEVKVPLGEQP